MKEQMKPIIMSTEDVLALLDGRKTMARMPIKPQPTYWDEGERIYDNDKIVGPELYSPICMDKDGEEYPGKEVYGIYSNNGEYGCEAPYKPGDVLWVRETWARLSEKEYLYQADDTDVNVWKIWRDKGVGAAYDRWMSPVTMPRSAARLFLRVKDVRVERVQDISGHGAESEGFRTECGPLSSCPTCNISEFRKGWDARNAKRGYRWGINPFVWVIEFERIEKGAES